MWIVEFFVRMLVTQLTEIIYHAYMHPLASMHDLHPRLPRHDYRLRHIIRPHAQTYSQKNAPTVDTWPQNEAPF